jgi:hypothetical protein
MGLIASDTPRTKADVRGCFVVEDEVLLAMRPVADRERDHQGQGALGATDHKLVAIGLELDFLIISFRLRKHWYAQQN